METLYTGPSLAKLLNLTERRVQQLAKEGVIPRAERGKYELAGAVRGYIAYLQERAEGRQVETRDAHAERTRLIKAQADKTELEVDERKGALIPAERVIEAWEQLVSAFRARVLALPSKLVPRLASLNAVTQIQEVIAAGVREALEELARFELAGAATAGDPQSGTGRATPAEAEREPVGGRPSAAQRRGQRRARPVPER
jgi:phage terminase Nu1 subunit (DNA packaging protein)